MRRIPVKAPGNVVAFAIVDDADYPLVAGLRWHLHTAGYAQAKRTVDGRRRSVYMHRLVAGLVSGDPREADHRNGNRLDCARSNLRVVTRAGNAQNRTARSGRSRFRGVSWHKRRGAWQAYVAAGGRKVFGGYFDDELDAALRAHELRRELMPDALPDRELVDLLERRDAVA